MFVRLPIFAPHHAAVSLLLLWLAVLCFLVAFAPIALTKMQVPFRLKGSKWITGTATAFGITFFVLSGDDPPFDRPRIAGAPFVWPAGCPAQYYRRGSTLPKTCFPFENSIDQNFTRSHGFPVHRTRGVALAPFYRLGNDAVDPNCDLWGAGDCKLSTVVTNVFVVTPQCTAEISASNWTRADELGCAHQGSPRGSYRQML